MKKLLPFLLALLPGLAAAQSAPGPAGRSGPAAPGKVQPVRLKHPVLVYYEEAAPGRATQLLVMDKDHLALLRYLSPAELVRRREVYVDGAGNRSLPGTDEQKYRLLSTSRLAETERRPAGDGRSTYSRLKVPAPGEFYMVRESAESYRHQVKSAQPRSTQLDFQANSLPGIDSVQAVYTLRRMEAAERGAGGGAIIR